MNTSRRRTVVFLFSGLIDCFFGGVLLVFWLGVLPINLINFDIPRNVIGMIGWVLAISGTVMIIYQATRLKEPDE